MPEISERDQRDLALLQEVAPNGRPTPEQVVDAAKAKNHPWHKEIWGKSDKDAAISHRLDLAREIIRRICFRIVKDDRVMYAPAYVRDPDVASKQKGYVATDALREQPRIATAVIDAELTRIVGCISRARGLADQFGMTAEFEHLLQQATALRVRLSLAA